MIESNKLINKQIISLYNCATYGKVTKLYISGKWKCKYLEIEDNDIRYILETNKIVSFDNDSIVIRNNSALQLKENMELQLEATNSIIGIDTYTTVGKYLGKTNNITLDDKYYIVDMSTDMQSTFNRKKIFNLSNEICLINDSSIDIKVSNCKPRKVPTAKPVHKDITVIIEKTSINDSIPTVKSNTILANKPRLSDTSMLLDRICTKTIINNSGEIICRVNARITQDIVKKCRLFGKLFELIKYSI